MKHPAATEDGVRASGNAGTPAGRPFDRSALHVGHYTHEYCCLPATGVAQPDVLRANRGISAAAPAPAPTVADRSRRLETGGCYTLSELPGRRTEPAVRTRYVSSKGPRWLRKPIEATVCHLFHRHLLSAIQSKAESG